MKVLYKDNQVKEAMMLVEAGLGAVIPEHVHGGVEWALVLEGAMEDDEGVVSAGNFVYRPAVGTQCGCPTGQNILASFMVPRA
jgi:anti-sigma factor ChrR (cupin superfamily)